MRARSKRDIPQGRPSCTGCLPRKRVQGGMQYRSALDVGVRSVFGEVPTVARVPRLYRHAAEGGEGTPEPPQDRVEPAARGAERGYCLVMFQNLIAENRLFVPPDGALFVAPLEAPQLVSRC